MPISRHDRRLDIDRMAAVSQRRRIEALAARARIAAIYASRAAMQPLENRLGELIQRQAHPHQVFELRRIDPDTYCLVRDFRSQFGMPAPNGSFDFVVLREDPGRIYVGANPMSVCGYETPEFAIDGHTSISGGLPVLFAGTVYLVDGRLLHWTPGSGHYQTTPAHRANLIPAVRLLLPEAKFRDPWAVMRRRMGLRC